MTIYRLALYAGIALISVGVTLFIFDNPRGILGSVELKTNQDIEAFAVARGTSTKYYDEKGLLSYTFKSEKLSHFRPTENLAESYTTVEAPDIVVHGGNKPWHLQARLGHVSSDQIITLSDNVHLEHSDISGEVTTMSTSELILDTDKKMAYTNKPVTINSPLGEITAIGMQADMSDKKIKLLSKVQGRHKPQKLNP